MSKHNNYTYMEYDLCSSFLWFASIIAVYIAHSYNLEFEVNKICSLNRYSVGIAI